MNLPRILWPVSVAAILGVTIAAALAARVPNIVDVPVTPGRPEWPVVPVDLGVTDRLDGTRLARIGLSLDRPESLTAHAELRLMMVTYDGVPTLIRGEIRVVGTDCAYQTDTGARFVNNTYLAFKRGTACEYLTREQSGGRMDLVLSFRGSGHIGLLTYFVPPGSFDPEWISLSARDPAVDAPVPVLWGRYVDTLAGPTLRRIDLLAHMWQVSRSTAWLWILVGVALFLFMTGGVLLAPGDSAAPGWPGRRVALRLALGVAGTGLGLALLYVGLFPPLQGPDEPDHLLAFAEATGRPTLASETAALARIGHFDRIRHHADERFRPTDVGRPHETAWGPEIFAHRVAERSVTTSLWWGWLGRAFRSLGAPGSLLTIRLANALAFGLFLGFATVLLCRASKGGATAPLTVILALLLVPTLPFFATHVSEFALLTSFYVLVTAVTAGLVVDGPGSHRLGAPLGLAISLVLASGRSTLPFAATLGAIVAGRALLGSQGEVPVGADRRRSASFWVGLGAGLAVYPLLSTPEYRNGLWPGDAGQLPSRFSLAAELLRRHPWFIVLIAPAGFVIERAMAWVRGAVRPAGGFLAGLVRVACYGAAAAVATSLAISVTIRYPVLNTIDHARSASALAYASEVLTVAATGFRLERHDFFLSSSFWAGFGWLDTLPGEGFVSFLVLLAATALAGLLVHVGRTADGRRTAWIGLLACGWVATLAASAVSTYYLNRNLHGRYLVGVYLSMFGVSWSVAGLLPRARLTEKLDRLGFCREWFILALVGCIHAYVLCFILKRYFG